MDILSYILNKKKIDSLTKIVENINSFKTAVVEELPVSGETSTIYFVPADEQDENNVYDEFIYSDGLWERVGSTAIDLSDYLRIEDLAEWAKAENKPNYTKSEIGLENVDNTADIDKPISTAVQTALNDKQDNLSFDTNSSDVTTKGYVDNLFTTISADLATKSYVDNAIGTILEEGSIPREALSLDVQILLDEIENSLTHEAFISSDNKQIILSDGLKFKTALE